MNSKLDHIRNLIHFAYLDGNFHETERAFILKVGERLGLENKLVEVEMVGQKPDKPKLPTDEILKFILLDDVFNLVMIDGELNESEIQGCKDVAKEFGFDESLIDVLVSNLKKHMDSGFLGNQSSIFIKNELYKLTSKNYSDVKYN